MAVQITKKDFLKYKKAQMSGKYNPIKNASDMMEETGLNKDQHFRIVKEYVDKGYSGRSRNRPALKDLINDLKNALKI